MTEEKFIYKYKDEWNELEALNDEAKKGNLSSQNIKRFTYLFRQSSRNLAYAQTVFPKSKVTQVLNQLIARSHNLVYVRNKFSLKDIFLYYKSSFPKYLREIRVFFLASTGIFLVGLIVSALLVAINQDFASYFLPKGMTEQISLDPNNPSYLSPVMSSYIMTNNINVSILAFITGIFAGVGTIYILLQNGMLIGALASYIFVTGGSMVKFAALIFPHGFIELMAIFISGACGLVIGKSLLIPKELKRSDSIIKGCKQSIRLFPGIITMLVIAGIIEGFFTPLAISTTIKIAFALVTLVCLIIYFGFLWRDNDLLQK